MERWQICHVNKMRLRVSETVWRRELAARGRSGGALGKATLKLANINTAVLWNIIYDK